MDIIQSITKNQGSYKLTLNNGTSTGTIFINEGEIISANLNTDNGIDIIYNVLTWNKGDFLIEVSERVPEQKIFDSIEQIILEAALRMIHS